MKKKVFIALIVIIIVIGAIISGTTLSLGGKIIFTTELYKNPSTAVEKSGIEYSISDDIQTIKIDENNGIYFALTTTNELLLAEMRISNEKYHFTGNYSVYDTTAIGDCLTDGTICFTETVMYNKNGIADGKLKYAVLFENPKNQDAYIIQNIQTNMFKEIWFVYEVFN